MSWNQQKVEDLKKLWNDGVATSRIGEQLGFTKNAVIGKAFRLGLERRQNSRKKISQPASFSSTTLYRETSSSSSSISVKKEPIRRREKFSFKKSIVGTGNFRSCQWPIGDPLEEGFHYCGGQNIPTKPYCIEHFKKAYNVDEKYLDFGITSFIFSIKGEEGIIEIIIAIFYLICGLIFHLVSKPEIRKYFT